MHDQNTSVNYTMKVPVNGQKNLQLVFGATEDHRAFQKSLDGCTYTLNGRKYQDVESLWREPVEELCKNVEITTDDYGQKVLKTYTQIPTFDSSDREWDSKELEFLFSDGKNIHLVVMRGGYRIARLTFYVNLLSADSRLKPVFEKLGWSTDGVSWN